MSHPPFHYATLKELSNWAKKLKYFRVVASEGYDKESSDNLIVHLRYNSASEYFAILDSLGVTPNKMNSGIVNPLLLRLYGAKEGEKYESEIADIPGYKQSGVCQIGECYVFLWANKGILKIAMSTENGPAENIINKEVDNAVLIEKKLESLAERIIDPPLDDPRCFCPRHYPDAFKF